jgi:hypothetical protein
MPRIWIVTEHRLIRQAQSREKSPRAHRPNDWRASVGLGTISSLRDPQSKLFTRAKIVRPVLEIPNTPT